MSELQRLQELRDETLAYKQKYQKMIDDYFFEKGPKNTEKKKKKKIKIKNEDDMWW